MLSCRYFFSFSLIIICFIIPLRTEAFDYKSYSKERKHTRALTPAPLQSSTGNSIQEEKKDKSSIIKEITGQILEELDSDVVPAKMFNATNNFSIYFKPARITKIGVRFKF